VCTSVAISPCALTSAGGRLDLGRDVTLTPAACAASVLTFLVNGGAFRRRTRDMWVRGRQDSPPSHWISLTLRTRPGLLSLVAVPDARGLIYAPLTGEVDPVALDRGRAFVDAAVGQRHDRGRGLSACGLRWRDIATHRHACVCGVALTGGPAFVYMETKRVTHFRTDRSVGATGALFNLCGQVPWDQSLY